MCLLMRSMLVRKKFGALLSGDFSSVFNVIESSTAPAADEERVYGRHKGRWMCDVDDILQVYSMARAPKTMGGAWAFDHCAPQE